MDVNGREHQVAGTLWQEENRKVETFICLV